ncbi:MAG TPA: hypothetical protein VHG91_15030 [Longimicrobium sp.]|nr:hypothetical protein [Longimicrobium sp.]
MRSTFAKIVSVLALCALAPACADQITHPGDTTSAVRIDSLRMRAPVDTFLMRAPVDTFVMRAPIDTFVMRAPIDTFYAAQRAPVDTLL